MTRKYELVYVVSPEASDDQVADLHTQVEAIVQRIGGSIERTDNWGRRRLAYEIGRHKEGTYVLEVINGTGELMKEIDRRIKVTDLIIRHLVVRVDEQQGVIERTKARRSATSQRRRIARGLPADRQPGEGQRGDGDDDRDDRFDMGNERGMDR
jgi:small subunit ribosomal protein S6